MERAKAVNAAPLTLWDRIMLGAVAGVIGAIAGALAVGALAWSLRSHHVAWAIVPASSLYFFAVAVIRGPDAGFFLGDAISMVTQASRDDLPDPRRDPPETARHAQWSSVWILAGWLLLTAVLAWR